MVRTGVRLTFHSGRGPYICVTKVRVWATKPWLRVDILVWLVICHPLGPSGRGEGHLLGLGSPLWSGRVLD